MYCYTYFSGWNCYTVHPLIGELIGDFVGLMLWGFYVCLFIVTIVMLRRKGGKHNYSIAALAVLFIVNLVQTVVTILRGYSVFFTHGDNSMRYWYWYLSNTTLTVLQDIVFIISIITADTILWWRLYIIWGRDKRVLVIPAIGVLSFFPATGYYIALEVVRVNDPSSATLGIPYVRATEVNLIFDLVNNWLVTLLIIWKLYQVGHRAMNLTGSRNNKYLRIILALVESGMLLSVVNGVFVGLLFANMASVGNLIVPSLTRISGIAPVMIMLQLSLGYEQPADMPPDRATPLRPNNPSPSRQIERRPRRDSLSLDISSFQPSSHTEEPSLTMVVKKAGPWVTVTPWKTVGGTDVAHQGYWATRDVDVEVEEEKRRKSSEF